MNVEMMRSEVAKAYTGDNWQKKVKRMPENQVIAVYHNLQKKSNIQKQMTYDDISR